MEGQNPVWFPPPPYIPLHPTSPLPQCKPSARFSDGSQFLHLQVEETLLPSRGFCMGLKAEFILGSLISEPTPAKKKKKKHT